MSKTPNAEYFIASLHNAGWEGTLDAQHEKIEALWKRITDERKRELAAVETERDGYRAALIFTGADCAWLKGECVKLKRERDELLKAWQDMTAKAIVDEILAERKG
jgi:hypothetical protein